MIYYRLFSKIYKRTARKMCRDCENFIEKGSKILDLGCGSGITAKVFQDFFQADLVGVDIIDIRVEEIPFQFIDGVTLPFTDNSFDTVLINYVLHHTTDPISLLQEAKRVTKKNIIIYEDLPEGFLSKFICKIHGISFNYFFQKNNNKGHFREEQKWKDVFNNLGLKLIFEKRISCFLKPIKNKLFILEKSGD